MSFFTTWSLILRYFYYRGPPKHMEYRSLCGHSGHGDRFAPSGQDELASLLED